MMEKGTLVRVLRDFLTTNDGELCVSASEYLQVIKPVDRFWVECCLDLRKGCVPSANITPAQIPSLTRGQQICIARFGYNAQHAGDIDIQKGDLLITNGKEESGSAWLEGTLYDPSGNPVRSGMFPGTMCWIPDPTVYWEDHTNLLEQGVRSGRRVEKFATVVYPLSAQLEDELDLKVGQVVRVTHIIDKDWCRGQVGEKSGIFPASFVRIIDSFPGDVPAPLADTSSYLQAHQHEGHEYDNTRPAFKGLDEGLKAAFCGSTQLTANQRAALGRGARLENMLGPQQATLSPGKQLFSGRIKLTPSDCLPTMKADFNTSGSLLPNANQGYKNLMENMKQMVSKKTDEEIVAHPKDNLLSQTRYENAWDGPPSSTTVEDTSEERRSESGRQCGSGSGSYQNIDEISVRPYAITLYPFCAQFDNELGFSAGEMVYLLRHIDRDWMEGEMDGCQGIFPKSYVTIILDCSGSSTSGSSVSSRNSSSGGSSYLDDLELLNFEIEEKAANIPGEHQPLATVVVNGIYRVAYSFQAEMDSDLTLVEGEAVRIISQTDANWCLVENTQAQTGLCPINHLTPQPQKPSRLTGEPPEAVILPQKPPRLVHEPEAVALPQKPPRLAVEADNRGCWAPDEDTPPHPPRRNESVFRSQVASFLPLGSSGPECPSSQATHLKGFDPLCSPDEEMIQLETELINKVTRPAQIPSNPHIKLIRNVELEPIEPRPKHRFKAPGESAQNLDSFISKNLSFFESASTSGQPALRSTGQPTVPAKQHVPSNVTQSGKKFDISSSVLSELLGNRRFAAMKEDNLGPVSLPPRLDSNSSLHSLESAAHANSLEPLHLFVEGLEPPLVPTSEGDSGAQAGHPATSIDPARDQSEHGEASRIKGQQQSLREEDKFAPLKANNSLAKSTSHHRMVVSDPQPPSAATSTLLSHPTSSPLNATVQPGRQPHVPTSLHSTNIASPLSGQSQPVSRQLGSQEAVKSTPSPFESQERPSLTSNPSTESLYATVQKERKKRSNNRLATTIANYTQSTATYGVISSDLPKPESQSGRDSSSSCNGDEAAATVEPRPGGSHLARPVPPPRFRRQREIPASLRALTSDLPPTPFSQAHQETEKDEPPQDDAQQPLPQLYQGAIDDSSSCVIYSELPESANNSVTVSVEINHVPTSALQREDPLQSQVPTTTAEPVGSEPRDEPETSREETGQSPPSSGELAPEYSSANQMREEFPPDKQEEAAGKVEPPARPTSTPLKSRSLIYNSVMSDRSTPSLPSLSHSYETLNGSDSAEAQYKTPMRPAPPVPTKGQVKTIQAQFQPQIRRDRDKKAIRQRKINSLKKKIAWKEKQLEEQLLLELDMYQDIAVARGTTYDTLNKRMDRCQANIESISDEIQQLQASLADEEARLEEEKIDELTKKEEYEQIQSQLRAKQMEEERKKEEERRQKNREHREHVVRELVNTEREYNRDLSQAVQAFNLDSPEELEESGIDTASLFGNITAVIACSKRFSSSLEELNGEITRQRVGQCFLTHAQNMKEVYLEYILKHNNALQLLERYNADPHTQQVLRKGVERLRSHISCFDISSILIKPVQRILKYPLLLNELYKCTESDSPDKADLKEATDGMLEIAAFMNESKRKKDLIEKYRGEDYSTLGRRISKLNMHSIGKKSARISQKFLNTLGVDSTGKDVEFEDLERQYSHLSSSVSSFHHNFQKVREQIHEATVSQFNMAENIGDLYKGREQREVERFRAAHRHILSTGWNQFNDYVEEKVSKPLQQLREAFNSPGRLIQKRNHKQLDFSAATQKYERNKDQSKARAVKEELDLAKANFEAMNSQLITELPTLLQLSTEIYTDCVRQFILARKKFLGRITKELLNLMDLPLLASNSGEILEVFLIKHSLVSNQYGRFSFASKTFRPEDKTRGTSPARHIGQPHTAHIPQTSNQRTFLRGKYAANKLYQATRAFTPTNQFEISLAVGDLLGVIQEKDPTGNRSGWFCDNGCLQGFVDASALSPLGHSPESGEGPELPGVQPSDSANSQQACGGAAASTPVGGQPGDQNRPVAIVAPYDEVAEDEVCKRPTRKAPPVPVNQQTKIIGLKPAAGGLNQTRVLLRDQDQLAVPRGAEPTGGLAPRGSPRDPEQQSHHSYEEIPTSSSGSEAGTVAYFDLQSQQDLSPIYEEIPGGSRCSMSSGSGKSISSPRGRFYYALYEFTPLAEETTMLTIQRGQVVRVVQVAGEWWYVENRQGVRGYVPASYLNPYQS